MKKLRTMREIKFRGTSIHTKKWEYGNLRIFGERAYISSIDSHAQSEVLFSTVGQFTGLTDCNGKEIFEGDILVYGGQCKHVVEFKHGMFGYTLADGLFVGYGGNSNFSFNPLDKSKEHEVIGNIHDNPELLKGGDK